MRGLFSEFLVYVMQSSLQIAGLFVLLEALSLQVPKPLAIVATYPLLHRMGITSDSKYLRQFQNFVMDLLGMLP